MRGIALRWFILIDKKFDGHSDDEVGLILHEEVHIRQQKEIGVLKYFWKYFISKDPTFKATMEAEAFLKGSMYDEVTTILILIKRYGVPYATAEKVVESFRN
jgi:hypothetical protein